MYTYELRLTSHSWKFLPACNRFSANMWISQNSKGILDVYEVQQESFHNGWELLMVLSF